MRDLILFSIDKNHFAMDLDKIKRIVQAETTTPIAGNAPEIEGVFRFEEKVLKVLSFRKMIGLPPYEKQIDQLFPSLKEGHIEWVEALIDTVDNDVAFTKAISPYECALGKWISSFNAYDDTISKIMEKLFTAHVNFHGQANKIIYEAHECKECAHDMIATDVQPLKEELMGYLDQLHKNKKLIANSLQKFLILDAEEPFAVCIDEIDDIIAIEDERIQTTDMEDDQSFVTIDGIFEHEDTLINLISSITLPKTRRV